MHVARCEMRCEGVGQTALTGQLRTEQARSQQPDRHIGPGPRHGDDALVRGTWPKVAHQFRHVFREIVGAAGAFAAQRTCGHLVGTGGTPQAQIDPARIKAFQGAELFGDHQRCVVGQHYPARTDSNGRRATGQVPK
ncbi:hypothetical protein D3C78_1539890 [compost metagenome]